jgi:hypothetical protein
MRQDKRSHHRQAEPGSFLVGLERGQHGVTRQHSLRNTHPDFTIILRWSEEQGLSIGQVMEPIGVEGTSSTYEDALSST